MGLHTIDGKRTSARDVMGPRPTSAPLGPTIEGNDNSKVPFIVGYQQGGFGDLDYGIKVAKQGYDARTATDDQLVMSSQFNNFKIVGTGTATVNVPNPPAAGGIYGTTINHDLGYSPSHIGFISLTPFGSPVNPVIYQLPYAVNVYYALLNGWADVVQAQMAVDGDAAYFYVQTNSDTTYSGDWVFKYYLLRETAN